MQADARGVGQLEIPVSATGWIYKNFCGRPNAQLSLIAVLGMQALEEKSEEQDSSR